jgi:glyoxylate utilization-related uncharacterized protein
MPETLFIDTNTLPRQRTPQGGEMTEVLNEALAGAKNVVATLRWLQGGERFEAAAASRHQLLYLMAGAASIELEGATHAVTRGMGVYLGPSEAATITAAPDESVKLFHLVVPQIPK